MAKKSAVSSTQKTSVQTKDIKKREVKFHPLITDALLGKSEIKKGITQVSKTLKEESAIGVQLGRHLLDLQQGFEKHFNALKKEKPSATKRSEAFYDFIYKRFGLKERRVQDYVRLAKCGPLSSMELPISSLIEISRLPEDALTGFLEVFESKVLLKMNFRQVQKAVSQHNPKAEKKTAHRKKDVKTPEVELSVIEVSELQGLGHENAMPIAVAELRRAFVQVKEMLVDMDGTPIIGFDSLLGEISQWIEERKAINVKKGA